MAIDGTQNRRAQIRQRAARSGTAVIAGGLLALIGVAAPAAAAPLQEPFWHLETRSAPTNLPLKGEGMVVAVAANVGDQQVDATSAHVTFTDTLPAGVEAIEHGFEAASIGTPHSTAGDMTCAEKVVEETKADQVECKFAGTLPAFEQLEIKIRVKTNSSHAEDAVNELQISGGGTPPVTLKRALKINGEPTRYGVESWEVLPENEKFEYDGEEEPNRSRPGRIRSSSPRR